MKLKTTPVPAWTGTEDPPAPRIRLALSRLLMAWAVLSRFLTLDQREMLTGRLQSLHDPVTRTWYCLACLDDLPAEPILHGAHRCR